jgi:CRP-like cAMP-binding protein
LDLVALEGYTRLVEMNTGDRLYEDGQSKNLERGLFFIECGVLKVEHDAGATATRGSMSSLRSLGGVHTSMMTTYTLRRIRGCLVNAAASETQMFRVARIGVGWVAGTLEAVSGMQLQGEQVAVDYCRLHHLPFSKIEEVEKENPTLALSLYKLLSYLMARRQEATIGQLATLHSIMSSPARWHSYGRSIPDFK